MRDVSSRSEQVPAPVQRLWRAVAPLLATRTAVRRWALATVVINVIAIATGAGVRLSASGLGCPDWPKCTQTSAVAATSAGQTMLNSWIEFGNRLFTVGLTVIVALTFIAVVLYKVDGRRRRDLIWLAAVQPLGVVLQAVVGGVSVLLKLNPAVVALHFLLSALLLVPAALVLHAWVSEGAGPVRSLVRADLRVMAGVLVAATGLVLAAGTVVTGTGPLAGTEIDSHGHLHTVPRFHLPLTGVTQFHADIVWFVSALAVALLIGLRFAPGTPRRSVVLSRVVLGWIVVQAVIGYVQYLNRLPAGLVWVHVASAAGLWVAVLRLYLSTRERVPATGPDVGSGSDAAAVAGSGAGGGGGGTDRPEPGSLTAAG